MKPIEELRKKDDASLLGELQSLLKSQFALRVQKATQQMNNSSQIKKTKRNIARVRTLQRERVLLALEGKHSLPNGGQKS